MPGDGWSQNIGVRLLVGRMLLKGFLPLWNPYMFGGTPLLASAYPGVLYPPNWLFAVVPYGLAMNTIVIVSYHIALIGTYLYARRLGVNRTGALVAGITYAFCGYMVSHLGHTPRIAAAAWLPWIILSLELLYQRLAWRWVALGAVSICMPLFASEPQVVVYALMVGGAYVLFSAFGRGEALPSRRQFLFASGAMVVIGLLLGALQMLPSMELMRQGFRAEISYDYFKDSSFPYRHLLTFIYPYFFGGMYLPNHEVKYWSESWLSELGGYAGVLSLLLALVALVARRNRMAAFWASVIIVALFLAFGHFLPFKINSLLFLLPFYSKFRVSARHVMEIGFAVSILAALGVQALTMLDQAARRRVLRISSAIFVGLFAATALAYNFGQHYLEFELPRPANADVITNPEQLIPLALCVLSLIVVWWYAYQPRRLASLCLLALMMFDMASFGHFFEWNEGRKFTHAPLTDPATIAALKAREPDRNAFRIVSQAPDLHGDNYLLLNATNLSQMRGLQTMNGFDVLMLKRFSQVAGDMGDMGAISDHSLFGAAHQGLNLFNVKYLLYEVPAADANSEMLADWRFSKNRLNLKFPAQRQYEYELDGRDTFATKLALVSAMGGAVHLPDGMPLARLRIHVAGGPVIERELQVGRDSGEWAWERADVREKIKHQRPRVARSWTEGRESNKFEGHEYLAEVSFPRAVVQRIKITYALPVDKAGGATWEIARAALWDETTGQYAFPERSVLAADRWRKLERFGNVEIYENLKALPRAWFVKGLRVLPAREVLRTIKEGTFSDGAPFDPAATALLEQEDAAGSTALPAIDATASATAQVTLYEPNRIRVATESTGAGLLVLSENYFPGWEATVDGVRVPIARVNYALRGVALPPGKHRVQFQFRSNGVRAGAVSFALGLSLLVIGGLVSGRRKRRLRA